MSESESYTLTSALPNFSLWEKMKSEKRVISFDLELTLPAATTTAGTATSTCLFQIEKPEARNSAWPR